MQEEWYVYNKRADFYALGERFGIDPVIARVIRNRDIETLSQFEEYINADLASMHSPHLFKDMEKAAEITKRHLDAGSHIRIIGDYDVDGINSVYILLKGLKNFGANVDYVVPHRIFDGYGISEKLIDDAADDGVKLIITCDNGIAAYQQSIYAKSLGMDIVITDHHEVPFEIDGDEKIYKIPPADAVVDAKQEDCSYPCREVCGAVVAYKFIEVMNELMGLPREKVLEFLEFAAMATICDVVELKGENRVIVKNGLRKIAVTPNLGLRALIEVNKLNPENITSYNVGFVIGPCLNATGRLDTARNAIDLLCCDNKVEAERRAGELKSLNEERRALTEDGIEAAISLIENENANVGLNEGLNQNNMVLVVFVPDCHESIAGIIAGKIRERYNKPALIFTQGEGCLKGSGRSTLAYNMFEKISEVKELLDKFGGHPLAAGMSLQPENLCDFRRLLNEKSGMTEADIIFRQWIDVPMPLSYISFGLVRQLSILEPFGKGNEKPLFADNALKVTKLLKFGNQKQYTRVTFEKDGNAKMEGVLFAVNDILEEAYATGKKVSILYYPDINSYNGNDKLQVMIKGVKFYQE